MKRTYKTAEAGTAPGGFVVRLDGAVLKTPLGNPLIVPSKSLAAALAEEWEAQKETINPMTMPMTQLANTMVDKSRGPDRPAMNAELLKYGSSDLICYHAAHPAELVKRQQDRWLPLIGWLKDKYGIVFEAVNGIQYHQQPEESLEKLKKVIEEMDASEFTVLQAAAMTMGSVALALALLEERLLPQEAYEAACVDEIYQLKTWGEDEKSMKRLEMTRYELNMIMQFNHLLRASS